MSTPTSSPIWVGPVTPGNYVKQQAASVGGPLLTDGGPGGGGGGGPTPYLGPIATGSAFPASHNAGGVTQLMQRSAHVAKQAFGGNYPGLQIGYANAYGLTETATGAPLFVENYVEYNGLFYPYSWSAQLLGTVASGTIGYSDFCVPPTAVPEGATFFTRSYLTCAGGVPYQASFPTGGGTAALPNGTTAAYGTSGVANVVAGGAIANNTSGVYGPPVTLRGMTINPTIGQFGDSIAAGVYDTIPDLTADIGFARAIGPWAAYNNCSISGDAAATWVAGNNSLLRQSLMAQCSAILCNYGRNDGITSGSVQLATFNTNLAIIAAQFPNVPLWKILIAPYSSSADNWVTPVNRYTAGNQTAAAGYSNIITANRQAIAGLPGWAGAINFSPAWEWQPDTGIWYARYGTNASPDGTHPPTPTYIDIRNMGVLNPALFVRGAAI